MSLTSNKTEPTNWSILTQLMESVSQSIHVMDVGLVVGVHTENRTIDVQPLTLERTNENEYIKKPIRYETPYIEANGIRSPINIGDRCIILYTDNDATDALNGANDASRPVLQDRHGINSGVAFVGLRPKTEQTEQITHLQLTDATKISITAPAVEISTGASGTFISQDNKTITVTNGIITKIL